MRRPLPLLVAAAAASAGANNLPRLSPSMGCTSFVAASNLPSPPTCGRGEKMSSGESVCCIPRPLESATPSLWPAAQPLDMSKSPSPSLQEQIIRGATIKMQEKESVDPVAPTRKPKRPLPRETDDTLDGSFSYYVREGRRSEIDEIADVLMDSFHPDSQPAFDSYIRRYKYNHLRMCFEAIDESDRGLFVACAVPDSSSSSRDEILVGFCSVDGRAPDPSCKIEFLTPSTLAGTSPRPYLSDLGVSTLHRRQGIGEKLVRACEEWTHRRGYEKLYLKVEKKNAGGYGLYSAMGYKKTKLPWGGDVAEAAWDTTVLLEKRVKDPAQSSKRKRTWVKNQLWHPIKKSVDRYAARRNGGRPPPL